MPEIDSDLSPQVIAEARRELMRGLSDTEWQMWRHNPITAAYLQYLDDMHAFLRTAAADFVEFGSFEPGSSHQDRNPDVLRGQIVTFRELRELTLGHIQGFYAEPLAEQTQSQVEAE